MDTLLFKISVAFLYLAATVYITVVVLNRMSHEDPYSFLIKGRAWWGTIVYSPLYPILGIFFWDAWKWTPCAINRSEYEVGYNSIGRYFSNKEYVITSDGKTHLETYFWSKWYGGALLAYEAGTSNASIWGSTFFVDWLEMCVTSELIDLNRGIEKWVETNIVKNKRNYVLNYFKSNYPLLYRRSDCYLPKSVLMHYFYNELYKAARNV